ncbi:MAG: MATE family efflux transporter [Cyanobacteria bacterium P01_F01_bin.86]
MKFAIETKAILRLAIPLTLIQIAEGMVHFVDTVMMGSLGTSALAAGSLGAIIFWTLLSLFSGLLEMTGALAAEAYGAGNHTRIRVINAQALWLSFGVSIPTMVLIWHLDGILQFWGQEPQIVGQTMAYLRAILWGLPAALGLFVFKEVTTALMQPRLLTLLMVVSIPINAALNYGLMFGTWGLPELGLAGIGWSSTWVFWMNFGVAAVCLQRSSPLRQWRLFGEIRQLRLATLREIVHYGWPLCFDYGTEAGALTVAALMMGVWGTDVLAAHGIVMTTTELLLMFSWGMSYAAAMRTAHKLGEGRPDIAKRVINISMILNLALVVILAVPLWLFPENIVSLYIDINQAENQPTIEVAVTLFKIGVIFQIFQGVRLISLGTLQGLHDTHVLATVDFLAHWGIGIGLGYLFGQWLNWQDIGLWWSLTLGQIMAALILTLRVQYLLRQRMQNPLGSL